MYSLLIVDDEPIIADGIFDLFMNYREQDLDVHKAYSGAEALEWMRKTRIDIVLTDISMPDINGLEVQKEIRRYWPACKVIFLSICHEFDFVQSAIRNDGADYILKTQGEEAILQAVKKAAQVIEAERRNEQLLEQAKISMLHAVPALQTKLLTEIADGCDIHEKEISRQFEELEIPLVFSMPVLLLVGKVDFWPENMTSAEKMKTIYGLKEAVERFIKKTARVASITYEKNKMLWMIQPDFSRRQDRDDTGAEKMWERLILFIRGSMDAIQSMCKSMFGISVSFAMSSLPVAWERLAFRFDLLKLKLSRESGLSDAMLLIDDSGTEDSGIQILDMEAEFAVRSQLGKISLLNTFLENGEKDRFFTLFGSIMNVAGRSRNTSCDVSTEVYFSISAMFLSYLNRWKLAGGFDIGINLDKLINLEGYKDWEEITTYFEVLAKDIFEQKSSDSLNQANRIFRFIKNYAEQHIDGDLSLTRFADLLHFHPQYLSRLFKQVTGKSFTDYIVGLKIARAKELLKSTNYKIHEVAQMLGFDTTPYFTRFFKNGTGQTPQEYRNSL